MIFLFYLSAIYIRHVSGGVASPVDTMKELLSCSGWRVLASPNLGRLDIIDRQHMDDRAEYQLIVSQLMPIDHLLATTVTEGNAADQIRLAHQFLSCSYARVLTDLCDYERGVGPQCRRMATASKTFDCLEDYLRVIRLKNPAVSRMTGALSSLYDLGRRQSQTQFQNEVFRVLAEMRDHYRNNAVVRPPEGDDRAKRRVAVAASKAVEQHARNMSDRLTMFYNSFCRPISDRQLNDGRSEATDEVRRFFEFSGQDDTYVVKMIKTQLHRVIVGFTVSHDAASGFEYDPESNITRIIAYDPNTEVRVDRMNRLLSNRVNWTSLKPLEIKENGSVYRTNIDDLLGPASGLDGVVVVTKENVYAKLKQAHQLLSCQYASILKECCDHVTDMWINCQESKDSVFSRKFLKILNEADPSVMRMIDALSYFYSLSPDTAYNKVVFYSLERFRSYYKDKTVQEDKDAASLRQDVETGILEIVRTSQKFYQQFCYSANDFNTYYVPSGFDNRTIVDKGLFYKNRINLLTQLTAVFKRK